MADIENKIADCLKIKNETVYPLRMTADKSAKFKTCITYSNGKTIEFIPKILEPNDSRVLQSNASYIFVIPANNPTKIYFTEESIRVSQHSNNNTPYIVEIKICDTSSDAVKKWDGRTRPRINHNNLARNEDIVCGGTFQMNFKLKNTSNISISNSSGHYIPHENCLDYATCLFDAYGLNVVNVESVTVFGRGKHKKHKSKQKGTQKKTNCKLKRKRNKRTKHVSK
jgi:hypothetical protein